MEENYIFHSYFVKIKVVEINDIILFKLQRAIIQTEHIYHHVGGKMYGFYQKFLSGMSSKVRCYFLLFYLDEKSYAIT